MRTHLWKIAGVSLAALAAVACNPATETTPAATTETATPAAPVAPDYAALLTAADRPADDAKDDAARKPAEVLAFSKIMPGQTVLEIEAGTGYYTELLSKAVGPTGKVIMQNPNFGEQFNAEIAKRNETGRLANVTSSQTMFDALQPADASVDVVTWFLGPHELYYKPKENPAGFGDPVKAYAEAFRVLKPGGYFVILDHAAKAGDPPTTGNDLHRIDPKLVKDAAAAAGFTLEEESPLLANPADDHTKGVFDPAIRRQTDQFLLRYKKPG
jgi:predicted methyltransferase